MLASANHAIAADTTIWMSFAATQVMVTSQPGLLIWTMCRIMVLPQPESMLISVAHDAPKGHMDAHGLDCNMWPCWSGWLTLLYVAMVLPGVLPSAVFLVPLQLSSVLMSKAHVTTGNHRNHMSWNPRAVLSHPWLALGELYLFLAGHCIRRADPTTHRRAGLDSMGLGEVVSPLVWCGEGAVSVARTDQLSSHPEKHSGPWVGPC